MSNPWLRIGAWAAEVERFEAEEKQLAPASPPPAAFPSHFESPPSKPRRKKKPETLSFSEFTMGVSLGPGSRSRSDARGLVLQEEKLTLPAVPRDRSGNEECRGGIGGAFRGYQVGSERVDREWYRGFGAGFQRERDRVVSLRDGESEHPSRADGDSDWCSTKKSVSAVGDYNDERRGWRISDQHLPSRADEVGKWGSANKPPLLGCEVRRESLDQRRASRADEVENWSASKRSVPATPDWRPAGRYDHAYREAGADSERWTKSRQTCQEPQRRRLVLAPRTLSASSSPTPRGHTEVHYPVQADSRGDISDTLPPPQPKLKPNPFGSARPREVVLAERGRDCRRLDTGQGFKEQDSRPSSDRSSRPETVGLSSEVAMKPRLKVNPFGDAKPREVLLEERGKDWRKMDFELEHRGVDRPDTEDEARLKQEIKALMELSKDSVVVGSVKLNGVVTKDTDYEGGRKAIVQEEIWIKERKLEQLTSFLDDKIRFSQRVGERPGSRSGFYEARRVSNPFEKPSSTSGQAGSRGFEYSYRPWLFSGHGEGARGV